MNKPRTALFASIIILATTFLGIGASQAANTYFDNEIELTGTCFAQLAFMAPGSSPVQITLSTLTEDVAGRIEIVNSVGDLFHRIDFTTGDDPISFKLPRSGIYQIFVYLGLGEPGSIIGIVVEDADPNLDSEELEPGIGEKTSEDFSPIAPGEQETCAQRVVKPCPDYLFVGARGSSEKTPFQEKPNDLNTQSRDPYSQSEQGNYRDWLGDTVGDVFHSLKLSNKFLSPTTISKTKPTLKWLSIGVSKKYTGYEAQSVPNPFKPKLVAGYLKEISTDNMGLVTSSVRPYLAACEKTKYIFAGYSQSAAIVRKALETRFTMAESITLRERTIGAILISDPLLSPRDLRLRVSGSRNWVNKPRECGILRLLLDVNFHCDDLKKQIVLPLVVALSGVGTVIESVKDFDRLCLSKESLPSKSNCKDFLSRFSSDLESNLFGNFTSADALMPAIDTVSLSKRLKFPIVSVCYAGDIVCSFGRIVMPDELERRVRRFANNTHTDTYKEREVSDAIATWISTLVSKAR